jgi:phage shock protein PspC (stress-responsive transcriptional regulator)
MSDEWIVIIVTVITVTGSIITAIITAIIMKRQPKPTSKR